MVFSPILSSNLNSEVQLVWKFENLIERYEDCVIAHCLIGRYTVVTKFFRQLTYRKRNYCFELVCLQSNGFVRMRVWKLH